MISRPTFLAGLRTLDGVHNRFRRSAAYGPSNDIRPDLPQSHHLQPREPMVGATRNRTFAHAPITG